MLTILRVDGEVRRCEKIFRLKQRFSRTAGSKYRQEFSTILTNLSFEFSMNFQFVGGATERKRKQ